MRIRVHIVLPWRANVQPNRTTFGITRSIIFANYTGEDGEFSEVRLEAFADSIKLNTDQFKTCLTEARYQAKLDEGLNLGVKMGVKGTPSIFVNGANVVPGLNEILQAVQKAEQGG